MQCLHESLSFLMAPTIRLPWLIAMEKPKMPIIAKPSSLLDWTAIKGSDEKSSMSVIMMMIDSLAIA